MTARALSLLAAAQSALLLSAAAEAADPYFSHNIHNWSRRGQRADYHALAMDYSTVTRDYVHSEGKPPDAIFDQLGVIKPVNAENYPVLYSFSTKETDYLDHTSDRNRQTLLRPERRVQRWYSMDDTDLILLSKFGCSKTAPNPLLSRNSSDTAFQSTFYVEQPEKSGFWPKANLQSRWVVNRLVEAYLKSARMGQFAGLMWDDIRQNTPSGCGNKNINAGGYYPTWKAGQKDLVKRVTDVLHNELTSFGAPYFVTGNPWFIGDKVIAETWGAWYADGSLRLDQYYLERGFQGGVTQIASGTDPVTGLPAFTYSGKNVPRNYIPANKVAVNVDYTNFGATAEDFLKSNLRAVGVAGKQGSWFGYFGKMSLDALRSPGVYVFTNADQLARAIPNFDNLAKVPLSARRFDPSTYRYQSTNSLSSQTVLYSRNPMNRELYAVFVKPWVSINLRNDESIAAAYFTDDLFNKTSSSALPCLRRSGTTVTLTCSSRAGTGIRIRFN